MELLEGLNAAQREAVLSTEGFFVLKLTNKKIYIFDDCICN